MAPAALESKAFAREVQAQTGSGEIRVRDVGGRSHVQTGSGGIRAENVAAPFYAHTGSGDIEAELTGSGDVDVETGSGGVHVRGVKGGLTRPQRERRSHRRRQCWWSLELAHRLRIHSSGSRLWQRI